MSFAGGEEFGAELLARFHLGMVGMIVIIYVHYLIINDQLLLIMISPSSHCSTLVGPIDKAAHRQEGDNLQ